MTTVFRRTTEFCCQNASVAVITRLETAIVAGRAKPSITLFIWPRDCFFTARNSICSPTYSIVKKIT